MSRCTRDALAPRGWVGVLLLTVAGLCGCAPTPARPEHLPTYRWTNTSDALQIMRRRAQSVRTVSARCLITLTRPDGESVRLDGALVMAPQDGNVRLRAWKFNQPVIDLTLNRQELWMEAPRDDARRQHVLPASLSAAQATRAMSLFGGGLFEGLDVRVKDAGGPQFEIRKRQETGQTVRAIVDRSALVVREYQLIDSAGVVRFNMMLTGYGTFDGIPWPTQLVATGDTGKIDIDLREVEINTTLPERAFNPPPRAEKVQ